MHSMRRAALRAACSSTRVVAVPRQQVASFAMQISKANMGPATVMPLARNFSQTVRRAEDEKEDPFGAEDGPPTQPLESSPTERERARQGYTIFVSNMTFDATDAHLREAFAKFGDITAINIGRDARGLSRGFGFVTFTTKDAADRAVLEAHKSFWHGRRINVDHRKEQSARTPGEPSEPTSSLYIGNIPYETSDADLNRLFRELEGVTDVRVAVDRNTGWPRGFAHADFKDVESCEKAYDKLSSITVGGRQLRLDYSTPRPGYGPGGNRG
ncbi:RNA-binding domain-containing protein [Biscogniauxia sp. FL1348]|nr:RNA-binding domain-containing protein [Biscogniauxia sp. FL1348]